MEQIEKSEDLNVTINWESFLAYIRFLKKPKNAQNHYQNEVLKLSNYFLISPKHILTKDNSIYYLEILITLSNKYHEQENIFGVYWVYNIMNKFENKENNDKYNITKAKIICNYADLLNKKKKYLHYAKQLFNEIGNFDSYENTTKTFLINVKNSIDANLQESNIIEDNQPPFNWIEQDDAWNPYIEEYLKEQNETMNEKVQRQNKIKVLLLLKDHKINIPIIPRYIYWKDEEDLKDLLKKLNCLTDQSRILKIQNDVPENNLLYLIHSFIENNSLICNENQSTIEEFISSQDKDNYILIILQNHLDLITNTNQISIPTGLLHFINFKPILTKLLESTFSFPSEPLKNIGNTCYFNAGLQSIMHCNKLSEYFLKNEYSKYYGNDDDLVKSYKKLLTEINQINIKEFVLLFIEKENKYERYKQHDSPELITDLLNYFSSATKRASYELHDSINCESESQKSLEKFLQAESSIITDLFYGQVQHKLSCKCGDIFRYEEFMLLDVPIPSFSLTLRLFPLNKPEIKTTKIYYYQLSDLTGQYVQNKIKETLNMDVDILCIEYSILKVSLIKEKDNLFYVSKFSLDKEEKNKNIEIVLYQKPDSNKKTFYLVPCKQCVPKFFGINNKEIQGYPVQVCLDNSNEYTKFMKAFDEYKNNESDVYTQINNEKKVLNIENEDSFKSIINNENDVSIFYFENKKQNISWERGNFQKELTHTSFDECMEKFQKGPCKIKCSKCGECKSLETQFTKLPHYFLIYFKRFFVDINTRFFKKNERFIEIKENIELTDLSQRTHKYKAFSMVLHRGSVKRGHYIAHCKEGDTWYEFDDIKPKCQIDFKPNEMVLVVFYEKQQ